MAMAVPPRGELTAAVAAPLFRAPTYQGERFLNQGTSYDVTPDGQQFVVRMAASDNHAVLDVPRPVRRRRAYPVPRSRAWRRSRPCCSWPRSSGGCAPSLPPQRVVLWEEGFPSMLAPGVGTGATQSAIGPDGSSIVFADSIGGRRLFHKRRDEVTATPLSGTEGARKVDRSHQKSWR